MFHIKVFADALHSPRLVGTIHDVCLCQHVDDVLTSTFLYQLLQVLARMEAIDGTCRIAQLVDDIGLIAIGVIDHGLHTESRFQTFGIEFCLRLAHYGVNRRLLGLYHCQRHTIGIEQHIVGIAYARGVRHTLHLYLYASLSAHYHIVCL